MAGSEMRNTEILWSRSSPDQGDVMVTALGLGMCEGCYETPARRGTYCGDCQRINAELSARYSLQRPQPVAQVNCGVEKRPQRKCLDWLFKRHAVVLLGMSVALIGVAIAGLSLLVQGGLWLSK